MDNNGNYERQFAQNLKSATPIPMENASTGSNKLLLVITIMLAIITLMESIALITTLNNYFSIMNEEVVVDESSFEEEPVYDAYVYDDDYNLTAFNLICTTEDGSYFSFDSDKKFEQHNTTGAISASGSYTITNDSLITLSGSDKVLYYDGFDIADGLTIYNCEENAVATEADADDSGTE